MILTTYKCKNCDFVSGDEDARFCPQCGQTLEAIKDEEAGSSLFALCPNCGSTANSPGAKFCIDCGASLGPMAVSTSTGSKPLVCAACGFSNNAADAKFCHQCGAALGKASTLATKGPILTSAAPTRASVSPSRPNAAPIQASASPIKRLVNGPKLKEMAVARLFDKTNTNGIGGKIMLLTDGILFVSNQVGQISFHIADIAKVTPGGKSNLLNVYLKNGETKTFKFFDARKWIVPINNILSKQA